MLFSLIRCLIGWGKHIDRTFGPPKPERQEFTKTFKDLEPVERFGLRMVQLGGAIALFTPVALAVYRYFALGHF